MRISYNTQHNIWIAESSFAEKDAVKAAGFWWHPKVGGCNFQACKACAAGVVMKWWTFKPECAAKLIDYCNAEAKAALQGVVKALEGSKASDADLNIPCPEGMAYMPFQKAGIAYAADRPGTLIADEMGCVVGSAKIRINRAGKGYAISLQKAYKRFHGLDKPQNNWDRTIPTYIRSLCNGELRLTRVKNFLYKGEKEVVKLTVASGKTLRVTPDHEIATPKGFIATEILKSGDTVLTNGKQVCPECGTDKNLITYPYAKFPGYCRKCMYRKMRSKPTWKGGRFIDADGYVRISGCQEHPRANSTGQVYEHILVMEAVLGRNIVWPEQIHHKNEDRADNSLDNLELITCSDHHKRHGKHTNMHGGIGGKGGSIKFIPEKDTVVSVIPAGTAHVYDVVCFDPYRNFVANGIIVHNCGKTIQAIGLINLKGYKKILIVVPASLRLNWQRELNAWLVNRDSFVVTVVDSADTDIRQADIVIINYDRIKDARFTELMSRAWDLLVVDEAHAVKNPKAQRTQRMLGSYNRKTHEKTAGLVDRAKVKLFLTGTPILNRPIELQPIAGALAPQQFGNFVRYAMRYCDGHKTRYGWDFTGASQLGELQDRLRASIMVRRLKADVLKELPPKTRTIVLLNQNGMADIIEREKQTWASASSDGTYEWFDDVQADAELAIANNDEGGYSAAVARLSTAMKVAFEEMSAIRHELAIAKVPAVIEHVDTVLENVEKLVLFAHHKDVIAALKAKYGNAAVVLDGSTPNEERQAAVDRFQNDSTCKVFIGSIHAAGVGITLTAASHVIFAELDWVPANVIQAEDRCHRIGQNDNVTVQHLVVDGSLDAKLANTLVWKQRIIEAALDNEAKKIVVPEGQDKDRKPPALKYPVATPEQRGACALALRMLAGMCDGARKLDGTGFNRLDTTIGKKLAYKATERALSDGEVSLCKRMLPKYHGQIGADMVEKIKG